jgi:hypothetical protein
MGHRLIPLAEREQWEAALEGIPHGFGHTWDSCHAFSLTTELPTYLYVFDDPQGARLVCPLMERRFAGEPDVTTPFGFAGFAGRGEVEGFPDQWLEFGEREGWACAYIAQNPMLLPEGFWSEGDFEPAQNLYWLELDDLEALRRGLSRLRRRQIKRWRTPGWLCTDREVLLGFVLENHEAFFRRHGASRTYRFTAATWRALAGSESVEILGAFRAGELVAMTLFGYSSGFADALFNISLPEGRDAATALMIEGAERLSARGVSLLNMGGGVHPGDSLEVAKRLFGARPTRLLQLKQVFSLERYERACAVAGVDPANGTRYFPPYQRPRPD